MSVAGNERRRIRDEIYNLSQAGGEEAQQRKYQKLLQKGGPSLKELIDGKYNYESKTVVGRPREGGRAKGKDGAQSMYSQHDKFSVSDEGDVAGGKTGRQNDRNFMYVKKEKSTVSKEDQNQQKRVHFQYDTDRGIKSQVYTADKRSMIQNIANNVL